MLRCCYCVMMISPAIALIANVLSELLNLLHHQGGSDGKLKGSVQTMDRPWCQPGVDYGPSLQALSLVVVGLSLGSQNWMNNTGDLSIPPRMCEKLR